MNYKIQKLIFEFQTLLIKNYYVVGYVYIVGSGKILFITNLLCLSIPCVYESDRIRKNCLYLFQLYIWSNT